MKIQSLLFIIFLSCGKLLLAQQEQTVSIVNNYNSWKWDSIYVAKNGFISVAVVPQAGGRILEYNLGKVKSLWTEPHMMGKSFAPTDEIKMHEWRNFGGYRIVPLPRTNCSIDPSGKKTQRWPPPAIWGDSPYSAAIVETADGKQAIEVTSGIQELPVPKWYGKEKRFIHPKKIDERLQYSRSLHIEHGSSKVFITHTIANKGNNVVKRGLLISSQHISESSLGEKDGVNYLAFVPFSNEYLQKNGEPYDIQVTPEQHWRYVHRNRRKLDKNNPEHVKKYFNKGTNWTGETAPGVFECHFDYDLMGGMHVISSEAWVCFVDKKRMTAFAKLLEPYDPKLTYAEGCDVSIFNSGMSSGYLETEIHTPVFDIDPNGTAQYKEVHAAAKIASLPVLIINEAGIITKRIAVGNEKITGEYGVFYAGRAILQFQDEKGKTVKEIDLGEVTPLKAFILDNKAKKGETIKMKLIVKTAEKSYLLDSL